MVWTEISQLSKRIAGHFISSFRYVFKLQADEPIVLFMGRSMKLEDNSWTLFRWASQNNVQFNPIWLASRQEYERTNSYRVVQKGTIDMIICLLKADIAITDTRFPEYIPNDIKKVNLMHGNPVKYDREYILRTRNKPKPKGDLVLATSEFDKKLHQKRRPNMTNDYMIGGYPRNDILFADESIDLTGIEDEKNIILYAPTQRQRELSINCDTTDLFPFSDFSVGELERFLSETNSELLLQLHPYDYENLTNSPQNYKTVHEYDNLLEFIRALEQLAGIHFLNEKQTGTVNNLLTHSDVLVTDYSSIYHDFLLLDRPIVFIPYDYEDFEHDFGFVYDYYSNMPGESVEDLQSLIDTLELSLSEKDKFADERNQLRNKIHSYQNNSYAKNIAQRIEEEL